MKHEKRLIALLMTCALILGLAACGGSGNQEATNEADTGAEATSQVQEAEGQTEIKVFIAASLSKVMEDLAARYNETHPDVKITYNADSSGKLMTQIEE